MGYPDLTRSVGPSRADDAEYVRLISKLFRSSATPRTAAAQLDYILRSHVHGASGRRPCSGPQIVGG